MSIMTSRRTASVEKGKWDWTSREQLRESWIRLLPDKDKDSRLSWVDELLDRSGRVLVKRDEAARSTETSHWFQRASAGASAAVATLAGGTLISGSIHGTAATTIGIIA